MNICSIFSNKPKNGELATELYQKVPTFCSSKKCIPLKESINDMVKLTAIQSKPQDKFEAIMLFKKEESNNNNILVRTIRKSKYEELLNSLRQNKQKKFYDDEFPPKQASLGPKVKGQINNWKRVSQIIENPVFIQKGISPGDLLQGGIDNCYFLGALACLAEKPHRIAKCLSTLQISPEGIYMVKFVIQGVLTEVIVDDHIPLKNNKPFFARSSGNQIWPMIFQKCWAKIFKNYQNISYLGYPHQSFYALTGAPTYPYYFKGKPQQQLQFWDKLKDAEKKDYPIAFGTTVDPKTNEPVGIVSRHIYTLLQIHQIKGYKLVKLRNPWGVFQWKGRASDSDFDFWNKFTSEQKARLKYENKNQGIFFMIWQDCPTYFDFIQICQLKDNAHFLALRSNFSKDNAQLFQLQTQGGQISISLLQDYTFKGDTVTQIQKTSPCFVLIAKYNPQRRLGYQFDYVDSTFKTMPFRQTILKVNLQKGKYVIYAKYGWTDAQNKQATINVYTQSKGLLRAVEQLKYPQLLQRTYLMLAKRNPAFTIGFGGLGAFGGSGQQKQRELIIFSSNELQTGGYGYIVASLSPSAKGKVSLQFDEKDFASKNLTLKKPYRGQKNIKIVISPGQDHIILFQCKLVNYPKKVSVPAPKISRLI